MTLETEIQDDFLDFVLVADLPETEVDIEEPSETMDDMNATVVSWSAIYTDEPSRFRPLSEREIVQYSRETVRATHALWCEYHADITERCRVVLGSRTFDIVSLSDWHEQGIILKLVLKEVF